MAGARAQLHAIVLDILLPGVNAFALCTTLRSEGNWTPTLMLTAKEDGEWDEVEALDRPADDYLTKPFSSAVRARRNDRSSCLWAITGACVL